MLAIVLPVGLAKMNELSSLEFLHHSYQKQDLYTSLGSFKIYIQILENY